MTKKISLAAKVKRHLATVKAGYLPVVFCVKCGSTKLDQNFINELRCYDCGNTAPWDGHRFSINRDIAKEGPTAEAVTDSLQAFNNA